MSRLSRVEGKLERVEEALQAGARTAAMIHRAEVGQLLRETVPVGELIELSRETASGDTEATRRLLEHVADAAARWDNGARPGDTARELIDREREAARRRLGNLRR